MERSIVFFSPRHRTLALVLCAAGLLAGCPSAVDRRAQEGLDALARCDVRGAHDAFDDAWRMDEARADVALAYALTDLATLAEDPALVALAPRLGFDRDLDTALLWGRDGLLDRLAREDECESIESWNRAVFPHPSVRDGGPDFWSTVDPTLTIGDVRDTLVAISPRLERTSRALQLAAENLDEGGVTIEGGCGVATEPTRVQRPDLLALAAGLEGVRTVAQAARGYDGSIPFVSLFRGVRGDDHEAWVTAMNAGFFAPTDPAAIAAARPMLAQTAGLARAAVAAARGVRGASRVADAVFDWTRLPIEVLDDVDAFAGAVERGVDGDDMEAIPRLSPALSLDLASFFTDPFDGTAEGAIWSVERDPDFGDVWIASDSRAIERLLRSRFDRDPWAADAPSYAWQVDWSDIESATWEAVFDPSERWSSGYACR